MEIIGKVVEVTPKFIRLRTIKKKQEIDVFFPESKRESIDRLYEPKMTAKLEVELEGFNIEGSNFARLWMLYVIWPEYCEPERMRTDEIRALFEARKKLYRQNP